MPGGNHLITVAGTEQSFPCAPGETILSAALRAGVGIAYECASGGCGSCKLELCSGAVTLAYPESPGLKARDFDKGKRLACMSRPSSDCTVRFRPAPAAISPHPPRRYNARLMARRAITHNIDEFRFELGHDAHFLAGQYALLDLPGLPSSRAYSMANQPGGPQWHFLIRRVEGGLATSQLFALAPGDVLGIDGPYSTAHYRTEPARDIVCVAGGSGLAPVLSIARTALADDDHPERLVHFYYGSRGRRDMIDPAAFGLEHPRLRFHAALSEPEDPHWQGPAGFVHDYLRTHFTGLWNDHEFYLAGPPPMVEATRRLLLLEKSIPVDQVHYDRFF